jgi:penicillin amidase
MIPEDHDVPSDLNDHPATVRDDEFNDLHGEDEPSTSVPSPRVRRLKIAGVVFLVLFLFAVVGFFLERRHIGTQMRDNLPQLDGSLVVYGLSAPVTVQRDAHGVPHIHASSMEDLVFAQGYITAQDRLWQMDIIRRHAAGQLAEILGSSVLEQDRLQRTLQLRATADRAVALLPPDQKRWLAIYANGVNASITAQQAHLPIEFRTIGYQPARWTPRDSILIELAMFQDLTTTYPQELGREALASALSPDLIADLYPTGSWRDHPPGQPIPDVTAPQPDLPDIPLDESQSRLRTPHTAQSATLSTADLLFLNQTLALTRPPCDACVAGSNGWAVAGSRTASGKPLLSNDMHLTLTLPGTWYEADLQADLASPLTAFHAAGITLPGTPFIIAGHNQHVAWGFTNLGADIQDLYIEHTRGTPTGAEYQTPGGSWRPVRYQNELIHVRGGSDVTLSVPFTRHGEIDTPIISSIFPGELRSVSLLWSVYDPATLSANFFSVDSATDWTSMLSAFSASVGLPLNLMYADDQGHIGYHAVGRIPIRGDANNPAPISPVPTDAVAPDTATHEWAGYIPFDQLPQAFDPADGILATANSRVTPDNYRYPITLNWMAPYRTERIYKVLESSPQRASITGEPNATPTPEAASGGILAPVHALTSADMLALQNDVFSELDQVIAQRLAYAIDHATGPLKNDPALHQAADILRQWNGNVDANAPAPAIVNAARNAFWPMLLIPKLAPSLAPKIVQGVDLSKQKDLTPDEARATQLWLAYTWGERSSVEEQLLMHTPARWLPAGFAGWDDFLAAVVQRGLRDAKPPANLNAWEFGKANPIDIEHPLFARSVWVERLIGLPVGTGPQPHSGDGTTVKMISGTRFGPSERFTTDLADPDRTTLDLVLGQSGNPASPYFMDQFPDWLRGTTYPLPFSAPAMNSSTVHTLTLNPR